MRPQPHDTKPMALRAASNLGTPPAEFDETPEEELRLEGERQGEVPAALAVGMRSRRMIDNATVLPQTVIAEGRGDFSMPTVAAAFEFTSAARQLHLRMRGAVVHEGDLPWIHAEELERYVPLYGYNGGWHSAEPNQVARDAAMPSPLLGEALREAVLSAPSQGLQPKRTVTTGTNHGSPTFRSDPEDHLIHFAMAYEAMEAKSLKGVESINREATSLSGLTGALRMPVFNTMTRTGFLRKAVRYYEWSESGRLITRVRARGFSCRRRRVMGAPTWINEICRSDVMSITAALKRSRLGHLFHHKDPYSVGAKVRALLARAQEYDRDARIFSDDAAAFDDSCSLALLKWALRSMPMSDFTRSVLLWQDEVSGILMGPLHVEDKAFVARRYTGLMTGTIPTTLLGSWINWCVASDCYAAGLGVTVAEIIDWQERGRAAVMVQGDDTLIVGPEPDPDRYTTRGQELGFERTFSNAPVFLKVYHGGSAPHTLASRAWMGTATRERRAAGPAHEILGALARWHSARGDPYFDAFFRDQARINPLWRENRISRYIDLLRLAGDWGFARRLEDERREARLSGETWGAAIKAALGYNLSSELGLEHEEDDGDDGHPPTAWAKLLIERLGALGAIYHTQADVRAMLDEGAHFDWRAALARRQSERAEKMAATRG